jgi:hypothetical protein
VLLLTPVSATYCCCCRTPACCAAGLFSCLSSNVSIYLSQRYEKRAAQMWADIQANGGGITVNDMIGGTTYQGKLAAVTCNAAQVLPTADVVVVVLPATAHEALFQEIAPYLSRQMIVFLPGEEDKPLLSGPLHVTECLCTAFSVCSVCSSLEVCHVHGLMAIRCSTRCQDWTAKYSAIICTGT